MHMVKIRFYGKSELAQLYYPCLSPSTARRNFNAELRACRQLWATLRRQGYVYNKRGFTPRQVKTIFTFLGEP